MAITWEVTILPISEEDEIVRITGTATDDTDPNNSITVSVSNALIGTPQLELAALDILYTKYERALTKQTTINTWLAGKEAAAVTNLEARQ